MLMEIVIQAVFIILAVLIVGTAAMVVFSRNIIHAALWLVTSFGGVAGLYLLLEAEFIAIVQVLVYIGAISILILFAIMLTRHVTGEGEQHFFSHWWGGLIIAVALFAVVIVPTILSHPWAPTTPSAPAGAEGTDQPALAGTVELGTAFMREYLLPFEIASIVLLVALIGAIVIAFEDRSRRRRVLTLAEQVALRKQQQEQHKPESGGSVKERVS
jgi:NADH-quinone oxidoreductase subunit J